MIRPFPDFDDSYANSTLLDIVLLRDMAQAIINSVRPICFQKFKSSINIEELKAGGSWTAFMKGTSRKNTVKCKLEYLPVIPFPSGDNIVKYCLDISKDLAEELGLDHIFVHETKQLTVKST